MQAGAGWLTTARLWVRPPTPADAPAVLRILADPAVVEHNPSDLVVELTEVEALLGRWHAHWEEHGVGNACVVERETGRLVGNTGLRRMTVGTTPVLNLMYRFEPASWGRGYATEAARAVVAWSAAHRPDEVVLARVRPGNVTSQGVARKAGLHRDPDLDDDGADGPDWAYTNRT